MICPMLTPSVHSTTQCDSTHISKISFLLSGRQLRTGSGRWRQPRYVACALSAALCIHECLQSEIENAKSAEDLKTAINAANSELSVQRGLKDVLMKAEERLDRIEHATEALINGQSLAASCGAEICVSSLQGLQY